MRSRIWWVLLAVVASPAAASGGAGHQSVAKIRAAAVAFVRAHAGNGAAKVRVHATGPDARLRLGACGKPLATSLPPGGRIDSRTTVKVSCAAPHPWHLYVPVAVSRYGKVAVAAHSFGRGDTAKATDIKLVNRDLDQLPFGWFASASDLAGRHFVRGVAPGTVITPAMLAVNNVIERGQQVVLLSRAGGVQVRMAGRALADAAPDERVRVENLSSHRIVEGVVQSNAIVKVMP